MKLFKNFQPYLLLLTLTLILTACGSGKDTEDPRSKPLRVFGPKKVVEKDGEKKTLNHSVPPFGFTTQSGGTFTHKNIDGRPYIVDFFFTTCPTICPKMTNNLAKLQKKLQKKGYDEDSVIILSHTVDPEHDSAKVLEEYAEEHNADTSQWKFLTGPRDRIYDIAEEGYLMSAGVDTSAPGGYIHSGKFVLLDQNKRVRGYYDGTDPTKVKKLMRDLEWIMKTDGALPENPSNSIR